VPPAIYSLTPTFNPGFPHDIFWNTYDPNYRPAPPNKNIFEWMIQYSRNSAAAALPVKLKKFTAELKNAEALLNWTTTYEQETKSFEVERAGKDLQFKKLASIHASGSSLIETNYDWIDQQPLNGFNYYRLVLINNDETREYFEIKKLYNPAAGKELVIISNPFRNSIDLFIRLSHKQKILITLSDIQGRLLKKVVEQFDEGTREFNLQATALPTGSYLLKVEGDSFSEVKRIFKQ
jgi:hypothetical protein